MSDARIMTDLIAKGRALYYARMGETLPVPFCGEDTCMLRPGMCMEHDTFGFFDSSEPDDDDEEASP